MCLFGLAHLINFSCGLLMVGHVLVGDLQDREVAKACVRRRKSTSSVPIPDSSFNDCFSDDIQSDRYQCCCSH